MQRHCRWNRYSFRYVLNTLMTHVFVVFAVYCFRNVNAHEEPSYTAAYRVTFLKPNDWVQILREELHAQGVAGGEGWGALEASQKHNPGRKGMEFLKKENPREDHPKEGRRRSSFILAHRGERSVELI